ncbi:MAG: hypothetical protein WDZ69_03125 [Candidatus Pacearchaeota archaeon]
MAQETLLQHWIFTDFALPFLLVFFIVFGILEKSKLFGEGKQLNAGIAFIIGMIFVVAVAPKLVVSNLILFLTVALVVMFVGLLLWGFVAGEDGLKFENVPPTLKWFIGIFIAIAVFAGLLWAAGTSVEVFDTIFNFLFQSSWSGAFWTNVSFIAVIIIALVLVLKPKSGK